jgi:hypothetical protein
MPSPTRAARAVLFLLVATSACADEPAPVAADPAPRDAAVPDRPRAEAAAPVVPPPDAAAVSDTAADLDAAVVPDAPPADVAAVADAPPADGPGPEAPAPDTAPAASQTPPQGRRQLDPWLAAGHYKAWRCEAGPANPRMGSPHGRVRICSNDLASRHGSGPYPVGAASVKEIYYGNRIGVFAVSIKVAPGTGGSTWYWYEQNDMEGVGAPGCAGCHGRAGNDHVYIQVK